MLTLADLGVLRSVDVTEGGTVVVEITPFAMVTGAQDVLSGFGVPRDRVHQELFSSTTCRPNRFGTRSPTATAPPAR